MSRFRALDLSNCTLIRFCYGCSDLLLCCIAADTSRCFRCSALPRRRVFPCFTWFLWPSAGVVRARQSAAVLARVCAVPYRCHGMSSPPAFFPLNKPFADRGSACAERSDCLACLLTLQGSCVVVFCGEAPLGATRPVGFLAHRCWYGSDSLLRCSFARSVVVSNA